MMATENNELNLFSFFYLLYFSISCKAAFSVYSKKIQCFEFIYMKLFYCFQKCQHDSFVSSLTSSTDPFYLFFLLHLNVNQPSLHGQSMKQLLFAKCFINRLLVKLALEISAADSEKIFSSSLYTIQYPSLVL